MIKYFNDFYRCHCLLLPFNVCVYVIKIVLTVVKEFLFRLNLFGNNELQLAFFTLEIFLEKKFGEGDEDEDANWVVYVSGFRWLKKMNIHHLYEFLFFLNF